MRTSCGILPGGEGLGECLRPAGHKGDHLSLNKYGDFVVWKFDEEFCGPEGTCSCRHEGQLIECFTYGKVPTSEARILIKSPTET